MKSTLINDLIDQLLARDGEYRPLALLLMLRRLDRSSVTRFEREAGVVLEDALYGDPDRVREQLNQAADRARALGLQSRTEARRHGQGQVFRRATADHQARTVWGRAASSAQADLFLDNAQSVTRRELTRALQQADRAAAEAALVDLARIDSSTDLLTDAEHLVGALAWLEDDHLNHAAVVEALEDDLAARATRLLGRADAERFIARFYRHLAGQEPLDSTSASALSKAELFERAGDPSDALEALDRQPLEDWTANERLIEIRASMALDQRERALTALCQLCWRHSGAAEAWLDACEDDELARRVEMFWDLEPALDIELFPAWLLARGYPVPVVEDLPDQDAAIALGQIRTLRRNPEDLGAREWLQMHQPELLRLWMRDDRPG